MLIKFQGGDFSHLDATVDPLEEQILKYYEVEPNQAFVHQMSESDAEEQSDEYEYQYEIESHKYNHLQLCHTQYGDYYPVLEEDKFLLEEEGAINDHKFGEDWKESDNENDNHDGEELKKHNNSDVESDAEGEVFSEKGKCN